MNRTVLLLVLLAAGAAACADNGATITIRGHAFPSQFAPCNFSPTGEFQLGPGVIDLAVNPTPTYRAVLYIRNNAADTSEIAPGTLTSGASWRALAAKVRVNPSDYTDDFPANPGLIPVRATMRFPLDGLTTPPNGDSAQFTDILNAAVGAQLVAARTATQNTFVVGVTLEGQTLSGSKLDSGEWFFSIQICNGCLAAAQTACTAAGGTLSSCFGLWQDPVSCQ